MIAAGASVLDARVLVINKLYNAVRVVDARRAFTMLCKGSAEIISVEAGAYVSYSLHSWSEVAEFQRSWPSQRSFACSATTACRANQSNSIAAISMRAITVSANTAARISLPKNSHSITLSRVSRAARTHGSTWCAPASVATRARAAAPQHRRA